MKSWFQFAASSALCLLLLACSTKESAYLQPPDLLEQLANADLSAKESEYTRASAAGYHPTSARAGSEIYPGDDRRAGPRRSMGKITPTNNGYELNFNDAALSELAKVILRDTLGVPYVYDPRVAGRVTVSTGGPVTKEELLTLLETVVSMNRGVLIREGNSFRISPEGSVQRGSSVAIDYVSESRSVGAGYGISVYPIKHMSAQSLVRMLETFVGRQARLRASVHSNLLVVRGSGKTRQQLLEVAGMFDVDWMKGQSAGIFVLRNATPGDVIRELNTVFRTNGGAGAEMVRFTSIDRMNAILALTQNSRHLDAIEKWVGRLDREGGEGDDFYVYRVENSKAKDLADILNATFGGSGVSVGRAAEESQVSPGQSAGQLSSLGEDDRGENAQENGAASDEPTAPSVSSASSSSPSSYGGLGGGVRIIPDEANNKLLIKAPARVYRKILKVLRRIDRPPLQVLINATLAEVTLNDNLKYGVQVFLQNNNGLNKALGFTNDSPSISNDGVISISPASAGLNFIAGSTLANAKVVLDALAAETAVRIVSSPSVVVLHNQSATLQVGDEVPVATKSVTSTESTATSNEIEYRDTGVILKVTPRVNSNGLVTMEVEQEISAVSSVTSTGADGAPTPTISQRRIASTIAVQNGQMVVLGGLISEQIDHEKKRVPVLRQIPYFGDVVGSTDGGKARTELVVFLQPRVIREPRDASRIAEEIRARMESLAPRPAPWDEDEAAPTAVSPGTYRKTGALLNGR